MPTLAEQLLTEEKRPQVVADSVQVIEDEVKSKKGASGLMIKAGFKTVKAFKRGILPDVVNALLDDFVKKLEPFYQRHLEEDGGDFRAFVVREADSIAEALLGITDERAERSRHKTLVKAYKKLRPQGHKQVVAAMPRVGAMLNRHVAE